MGRVRTDRLSVLLGAVMKNNIRAVYDCFEVRLKNAMYVHKLNQKQLAGLTGLSVSHISLFCSGIRRPRFEHLVAILAALPNTDARWLIAGDE